jgi:hypothetical protein
MLRMVVRLKAARLLAFNALFDKSWIQLLSNMHAETDCISRDIHVKILVRQLRPCCDVRGLVGFVPLDPLQTPRNFICVFL